MSGSDVSLKERINGDLKTAMLAGDKQLVTVLRSIKSAILYKEVESGKRDEGLDEQSAIAVLKKEKKSRQDALDMYRSADEQERADEEQYQMDVISTYLPEQLSEDDTMALVQEILSAKGIDTVEMKHMGVVMGELASRGAQVDGSLVSKVMKGLIEG